VDSMYKTFMGIISWSSNCIPTLVSCTVNGWIKISIVWLSEMTIPEISLFNIWEVILQLMTSILVHNRLIFICIINL
jgi:hypothetical protein